MKNKSFFGEIFFYRKKSKVKYFLDFRSDQELDPDPLFHEMDPDQNETDPKHRVKLTTPRPYAHMNYYAGP